MLVYLDLVAKSR